MRLLLPSAPTLVLVLLTTIAAGQQMNRISAPSDVAAPPADAARTASGLATKVINPGSGKDHPGPGDLVTVYSTGWTTDGTMWARGEQGTFIVEGGVFGYPPGMSEGIQLMVPGETRRMWIPESLAYKDAPQGFEVPKGMVVMDVQLIKFQNRVLSDAKGAPASAQNTVSQSATPSIDASKVKFLLARCRKGTMWTNDAVDRQVHGIVASEVDLSQDVIAKHLLQMAATFAQEACPSTYPFGDIYVELRHGDPATFTDAKKGFEHVGQSLVYYPSDAVHSASAFGGTGGGTPKNQLAWREYFNRPQELRHQRDADEAKARQRDAAREQQRQAEQRNQSEIAARSSAFVKTNGVAHFVTVQQLTANPFVYQGQVVAIYGDFQQMNSATQSLFSSADKAFVVSGIPTARFTQQRSMVMLAGRVLGNIEIKLPVLGPTLVPHLSFVGSAFCQQRGCGDYAINLK